MTEIRALLLSILFIVLGLSLKAQNDSVITPADIPPTQVKASDSVKVVQHKPSTAMLLSLIPGGGQIYNHKAWKIPIIYAGLEVCGYFIYQNAEKMVAYRNEFINRRDGHTELLNPNFALTPTENLVQLKNDCMRKMEIFIGVGVIVYALNIIDAMVDAHLYYFDISDDLSLHWTPTLVPSLTTSRPSYGATVTLKF